MKPCSLEQELQQPKHNLMYEIKGALTGKDINYGQYKEKKYVQDSVSNLRDHPPSALINMWV